MSDLIWHYTSLDSCLKILESKELWASDIRKMNDPKEVEFGQEIISQEFIQSFPEHENVILQMLLQVNMIDHERIKFSCSFSDHPCDLSQWRAYGSDGEGVSIGIDPNELLSANEDKLKEFTLASYSLLPVIYGVEDVRSEVRSLIDAHIEVNKVENWADPIFFDYKNDRDRAIQTSRLLNDLSTLVYRSKDDFYRSESEKRAIFDRPIILLLQKLSGDLYEAVDSSIKLRLGMYGPTFYTGLKLRGREENDGVIKAIQLGPKCKASKDDMKTILRYYELKSVGVVPSERNYR